MTPERILSNLPKVERSRRRPPTAWHYLRVLPGVLVVPTLVGLGMGELFYDAVIPFTVVGACFGVLTWVVVVIVARKSWKGHTDSGSRPSASAE